MTHEFDLKEFRKYGLTMRVILVFLYAANVILSVFAFIRWSRLFNLILAILWAFNIGIIIIGYLINGYIGKRSVIIEDGTHVVYRRYKLIHGQNQIRYIDYHIVNVLDVHRYWGKSLRVFGEIVVVYVRKNEEIHRVKKRDIIYLLPYFKDTEGLLWHLKTRAEKAAIKRAAV